VSVSVCVGVLLYQLKCVHMNHISLKRAGL